MPEKTIFFRKVGGFALKQRIRSCKPGAVYFWSHCFYIRYPNLWLWEGIKVCPMYRYIIFNNVGYIHSRNTFVRQQVCAHKRRRIWAFLHSLFEKEPISVPFVCTYFLSHKCVYWVCITHIIQYNVSAHLKHTFMASHNQKLRYFLIWLFLGSKTPKS